MPDRRILPVGLAILLVGLFGPSVAFATVKCQCNDGAIAQAIDVDYDDDDLDDACNDACSMLGGGRVWNVDTDQDDDANVDVRRERRPEHAPASPRR